MPSAVAISSESCVGTGSLEHVRPPAWTEGSGGQSCPEGVVFSAMKMELVEMQWPPSASEDLVGEKRKSYLFFFQEAEIAIRVIIWVFKAPVLHAADSGLIFGTKYLPPEHQE